VFLAINRLGSLTRVLLPLDGGPVRRAVEQARRNARSLEEWLTKASGERVIANAILTLPGWWVTRKAVGEVNVLNPDEIKRSFPKTPGQSLSPAQIDRLGYHLTERCRLAQSS